MGNKPYEGIASRAERGDYSFLVEPFDYLALDKLPDEGTTVGGFYQIGTTVNELLRTHFKEAPLTPSQVAGRLRTMQEAGMTRQVQMVGGRGTVAWQKTKKGKELLTEWQSRQSAT